MPRSLPLLTVFAFFLAISCGAFSIRPGIAEETEAKALRAVQWKTRDLAGWQVYINRELLRSEPDATKKAIELLRKQLNDIIRELPAPAVAELKKVPLYFSPAYPGKPPGAEFHPGSEWLRDNGRDPVMEKGVEFSNILTFEEETVRMPNFALHELAHAYHNLVLPEGFGNPALTKAYDLARSSGKYDRVERWHGVTGKNTFEKAYAMSNPMEYFAEATEAYFSRNDFYPFTKKELQKHDPEMFELMGTLWDLK